MTNLIFLEFISISSLLYVLSTLLQLTAERKAAEILRNSSKVIDLAKIESLLSLIHILSSDNMSEILEGAILAVPLKLPMDDAIKFISDNWSSFKSLVDVLNSKIEKVNKLVFLENEIKTSLRNVSIINKLLLILLLSSIILILTNQIVTSFLLSGLTFGISLMSVILSVTSIRYTREFKRIGESCIKGD
ncbi:hypothetical protein BFU36_06970 [Sulfolobus sp. A20]|uniref:hypothetical protein n=1 Tax=Saccharolobus sp. A20 TaxID=1891280 RepID=UPI000845F592|nr:hypothetical protein [Sulfolobus sp. A20]TRM74452.1 hypothetical protein DJ523_04875 [Sulfolobus sp. E5]TRM75844.1 hypothetical protein DJ532_09145 [Sulfolobus sp. A20-N-F8]TRM79007.1 hypothetical protein DJ528_03225 [Sulfolobus sp. B5]TRM83595.1 hypothetical protein DJ531_04965 [Sulfolobus sp. A20-N-F6]TRM84914.1 hypothetical protein DJ522_02805 [Sulfolobus sp. F3]TRM88322.1 hypothetical protein DJ529_05605 [Sulfolobus sp. C3]TRN01227.1 hypothetical protein DJ530_06120 [Sulfolobus sp. E1